MNTASPNARWHHTHAPRNSHMHTQILLFLGSRYTCSPGAPGALRNIQTCARHKDTPWGAHAETQASFAHSYICLKIWDYYSQRSAGDFYLGLLLFYLCSIIMLTPLQFYLTSACVYPCSLARSWSTEVLIPNISPRCATRLDAKYIQLTYVSLLDMIEHSSNCVQHLLP